MKNKVAFGQLVIKEFDEESRTITGIASTISADRQQDIVVPKGVRYKLPIPFLHQHNHKEPIGHVIAMNVTDTAIEVVVQLAKILEPGKLKDRIDEAWQEIKYKLVRGLSIGFNPITWEDIKGTWGVKYTEWEMLELSSVTIPANAEGSIQTIKSLYIEQGGALATKPVPVVKTLTSGVSEKNQTMKIKPKEVLKMATIKEQLQAYEDTLAVKSTRMKEMLVKTSEEGLTFDSAETEEYDGLADETKALRDHITRYKSMVEDNEKTVKPVEDKSKTVSTVYHVKAENEKLEPGIEFTRFAMCQLASKGNPQMAASLAKSNYPKNERVIKTLDFMAGGGNISTMMKASVAAGTTTDPTWAAPLVEYENFAGDFVDFLRPQTIIGQFGTNGIPSLRAIPFNVRIGGQTSGGSAGWVGEGKPKPLTKFDFESTELRWAKIASIAVITNELMRFGSPSAERLVRDSLSAAVIERMDIDFVDPAKAAVANVSPASITNGAVAVASTAIDADGIRADMQNLIGTFIAARNPARSAVFIMDSTTALALSWIKNPLGQPEFGGLTVNGGSFMGYPVIVSDHLPSDSSGSLIVLANASDIWLADDGQVTIDASREASLQMLDNPTNNSGTSTATSMVSMFQTNSTAILAERYVNWARRRVSAVAYLTGVNYQAL